MNEYIIKELIPECEQRSKRKEVTTMIQVLKCIAMKKDLMMGMGRIWRLLILVGFLLIVHLH